MAAKAEKTGSSVSCFNSSKSYDPKAVEDANTEGKGKKSFFQKLLGTKTKKIVGIAIASIVVATLAALTVALAASLGANSPGENIDPPVNETLGSGEIPTVNGTGLPTVNSTETPVISAETPEITTETQPTSPPTSEPLPTDPSLVSLCGYRPDAAMESACAQHPFSFYENLNTEGMSESELKRNYYECVAAHTSDPCNDLPAFSTVADLPDGIIYAFAGQGRNSTLPVTYDAGFYRCHLPIDPTSGFSVDINTMLRCSARRSDIEALPSNCPCVPDNTIDPNDVPSVAAPDLPVDILESPSDSICGSEFVISSNTASCISSENTLSDYNSLSQSRIVNRFGTLDKAYKYCAFLHTDAACKRLPIFSSITTDSDKIYRFAKLEADSGLSYVYNVGRPCVDPNTTIVSLHITGRVSDEQFAEFQSECLIERAVAAAALSNCPCSPELGTITV